MGTTVKKVYIVSKIGGNMDRYVLSVHETEEGAARAILEDAYMGDWTNLQELMGWIGEDYPEDYPEDLTDKQMETVIRKMIQEYHDEDYSDVLKHLWADEQEYGFQMDAYVLEE